MRGKSTLSALRADRGRGSPPPMRGKVPDGDKPSTSARITPAHAGKSDMPLRRPVASQDHPRPCGKKRVKLCDIVRLPGSPPPMRGKAGRSTCLSWPFRIIPAHAGKRCAYSHHFAPREDHPRPCGEKPVARHPALSQIGSPPPMRGKDTRFSMPAHAHRITPAHAGKSLTSSATFRLAEDHPRPCGEKVLVGILKPPL